jgi:hypothetical protein
MLAEAGLPECCELVGRVPGVAPEPAGRKSRRPSSQAQAGKFGRSASARQAAKTSAQSDTYDFVGIVMAKSAEGDAVARFMARREDVEVLEQPAFWDIRAATGS